MSPTRIKSAIKGCALNLCSINLLNICDVHLYSYLHLFDCCARRDRGMYFYIHAWVRAAIPFGAKRMVDKFVKNVGQLITMIGEAVINRMCGLVPARAAPHCFTTLP